MHPHRRRLNLLCSSVLALLLGLSSSPALWITNTPVADASLMEIAPDNSCGGMAWVLSGRIQNGPRVRALYRFSLAALPTNTVVLSGVLRVNCTGQSTETMCVTGSSFGLHRMLRPWGEGTNSPILNPGQGLPANAGDATWNHAFSPTNAWAAPGGLSDVDYAGGESSFCLITTPDSSPYAFASTPEFADDLQAWVNNPTANFGWIVIGSEDLICAAKRLNSREDPNSQPQLEVEFRVPPHFDTVRRQGNQFQMNFTPWPGQGYAVQYRTNLTTSPWLALTNLGIVNTSGQIQVNDSVNAGQRFYRLSAF